MHLRAPLRLDNPAQPPLLGDAFFQRGDDAQAVELGVAADAPFLHLAPLPKRFAQAPEEIPMPAADGTGSGEVAAKKHAQPAVGVKAEADQHPAPHVTAIQVFDQVVEAVARVEIDLARMVVAAAAEGTALAVVHDGGGRIGHLMTIQPGAPAEVMLLAGGKVVLVKPAATQEEIAAHQHASRTAEAGIAGLIVGRPVLIAIAAVKAAADDGNSAAGRIDGVAPVVIKHFRGAADNPRIGQRRMHQLAQPVRRDPGIVIEENQVFACCGLRALIIGLAEAVILIQPDDLDGRVTMANIFLRAVGGGVIHQNDLCLILRVVQRGQGTQAVGQEG